MDLSVCVITTHADMQAPAFQRMLASLPRGCELVVLVNRIGNDVRAPELMAEDNINDVRVMLYDTVVSSLNLGSLRNACAQRATRTWCMWMDADDEIVSGDVGELVASAPPSVGAYYAQCTGMQAIDGGNVTYYTAPQVRLWRRTCGDVWIGHTHEMIDVRKIASLGYLTAHADVIIHHHGYVCSRERHVERLARNVRGVMRTLLELWDSDAELRAHYLRVLADNLHMYHHYHGGN
ncbi:MAG: hypothetical protein KatS3mg038_1159 [Candidatus Kapaibacterium sp.]|nr:MAG: hypothetical protein KatS3mg038_1159 [Candidatus Kapabacteria bacterium]